MPNKIILKKSSVANKVPLATDLDVGELAVNLADAKLYSKNAGGTVISVGGGGSGNVTTNALFEHANTITANYTIATGNNAISAGAITIANGITVTVPNGSTWSIV